jgi:hypothetical protein
MRTFLIGILIHISILNPLYSQNFNWKAKIGSVETEGYYKIYLTPEITSKLGHSFPDIRIVNENDEEIQYILKKQKTIFDKGSKFNMKILKNRHKKFKHYTEVVVQNKEKIVISNLIFRIINIHNPIYIKILGSDDQEKWYVLRKSFPVVPEITESEMTEIRVMDIPTAKFEYYKILFHDNDEIPITVNEIYYHQLSDIRAEYVELSEPVVKQIDTLDKSIVTIEFKSPQFIDMLNFGIMGPEFYLRKAKMRKLDTITDENTSEVFYDQLNKDFYFGSLKSNKINLYDYKAQKIDFIVDNKDNEPLTFFKVNAYQLKNYLVAYLKPDVQYYIVYGDDKSGFPSYDLPYFKDTIPDILPETYVYDIKKLDPKKRNIDYIWKFPEKSLWYIIACIGVVLIFVSIKLLRERFGKKNNQNTSSNY